MIHAHIDTVSHKKIIGFETGTRAQFDKRHGGDPSWVFLDSYIVKYHAKLSDFLINPTNYKIDQYGELQLTNEPPIVIVEEQPNPPAGYIAITGSDGRYIKGADGYFVYGRAEGYVPPPDGYVYIIENGSVFIKDSDGKLITETDGTPTIPINLLNDIDGLTQLLDIDGTPISDVVV